MRRGSGGGDSNTSSPSSSWADAFTLAVRRGKGGGTTAFSSSWMPVLALGMRRGRRGGGDGDPASLVPTLLLAERRGGGEGKLLRGGRGGRATDIETQVRELVLGPVNASVLYVMHGI